MYLVKVNKVLSFMNKTKQIHDLNIFLHWKLENEFGNSLDLNQRNRFREPITELIVNFTE